MNTKLKERIVLKVEEIALIKCLTKEFAFGKCNYDGNSLSCVQGNE